MTDLLQITTVSSIWTFDADAKTYTRVSRTGEAHPVTEYLDGPQDYEDLSDIALGCAFTIFLPGFRWLTGGRVEAIDTLARTT